MSANPTSNIGFQNFFMAHLSADVSATATDIPLDIVPTPTEGFLVIDPDSSANHEIIYYNTKTASKVVCPSAADGRGQDGTTATPHGSGTTVIMAPVGAHFSMFKSLLLASSPDWTSLPVTPVVTSNNGQREHLLTYIGADYTDRLQPGTKLRIPRTSTVPTQSGQFVAANSQYATKASPTGLSFTGNFTVEAWVKLNTYPSGSNAATIISRDDNTNGWFADVQPSGQLRVVWRGAGGTAGVLSYASVPLGKWVHVALVANTATTASTTMYIDGASTPTYVSINVTTAVAQGTGALQVGNRSVAANTFLDGQLAGVRVWGQAQTQQQIRDNANKELVGNETGLVCYYKLNGNFNDSTANANNLTATGGAIATYADNPFNAVEYAIATKVAKVGSDTQVTVFSGSNAIPAETLGATNYSGLRSPYGFPTSTNKWTVTSLYVAQVNQAINNTVAQLTGKQLSLPTGSWKLRHSEVAAVTSAGLTYVQTRVALSTSSTTMTKDLEHTLAQTWSSSSATNEWDGVFVGQGNYDVASQTTLYKLASTNNSQTVYTGGTLACNIIAECAYL